MGRATQGVRLINLEKRGDTIASVCCVDTDPEEEAENDVVELQAEVSEAAPESAEEVEQDVEPDDEAEENDTETNEEN